MSAHDIDTTIWSSTESRPGFLLGIRVHVRSLPEDGCWIEVLKRQDDHMASLVGDVMLDSEDIARLRQLLAPACGPEDDLADGSPEG